MVREAMSRVMAIPRANLAGPRSAISHCDSRKALKAAISSGDNVAEKMLLMYREKIMVPVGD
jgi:hypothetical protein